jgi:DNA-directed RNA polymerase specialized sigma24 family protein
MADAGKQKALRAVRAAQGKFERAQGAAARDRRKAFVQAQKEGLTLREIGAEVGLHHTRVGQIIRGK